MKKAEMMSEPFYYIFIMIVIVLILLFGFNVIKNLGETNELRVYTEFKMDINKKVQEVYYLNPESKKTYSLTIPKNVKEVCFEQEDEKTKITLDNSKNFNSFDIKNLQADLCKTSKNNKLSFVLENKIISQKTKIILS